MSTPRHYYVYVIEAVDKRGSRIFYVGQSALRPEERLSQHSEGKRYCDSCITKFHVHGKKLKLRWDLFSQYNPLLSRDQAERVERWLAKKLRARGYNVRGGS